MQLNTELVRDVLLLIESSLESYTDNNNRFCVSPIHWKIIYENETLNRLYLIDEIKYCILKLEEGGLITITKYPGKGAVLWVEIQSVTFAGHSFANNIRNDTIWKNLKNRIGDFLKISLPIAAELAGNVALQYYKNLI